MNIGRTASNIMISLTALAVSLTGTAALAAGPQGDMFNRSTGSQQQIPAPMSSTPRVIDPYKAKATPWFNELDQQVGTHMATTEETLILTRQFGAKPQLEQVIEWTNTAAALAKKYRQLANTLKAMPLTEAVVNNPEARALQAYKRDLAQWYEDSADWLQDYIKPRAPARTIEELDEQLKIMDNRSQQLKTSMAHLQEMDSKLRNSFNVTSASWDNAIGKYSKKLPMSTQH